MMQTDRLHWENTVVLYLVQALLGQISTKMRAISMEMSPEHLVIHFAVMAHSEEVDEDIDDILFELEALFETPAPSLESKVFVGHPSADWPGRHCRFVYRAKE